MIRAEEQMQRLMLECIGSIRAVLTKDGPMRVHQTDEIIDMIFAFFISNSISSMPEEMRQDYLKQRMLELSRKIAIAVDDDIQYECPGCPNCMKITEFNA